MAPGIGVGIGIPFRRGGTDWSSYWTTRHAELGTYVAGLTTPLSEAQIIRLGEFIEALKTGLSITNLSDAFDAMWVLAGETEESSLRNLVSASFYAVNHGCVHTPLEGFTGDAGTHYVDGNYNTYQNGLRYTQNNASFGYYSTSQVRTPEYACGSFKTTLISAMNYNTGILAAGYINSEINISFPPSSTAGFTALSRSSATQTHGFNNNVYTNIVAANNSGALPNINVYLAGGFNYNGALGGVNNDTISFEYYGRHFTKAEMKVIMNAVETYMEANGVGALDRFKDNILGNIGPYYEPTALVSPDGERLDLWVSPGYYLYSTDGITFSEPVGMIPGIGRLHMMLVGSTYYAYSSDSTNLYLYTGTNRINFNLIGTALTKGDAGTWDSGTLGNVFVFKEEDDWYMLYESNGSLGWCIGLATSADGVTWTKYASNPVLHVNGGTGNPELPRVNNEVIKYDGKYYCYYHHGGTYISRAYSTDLITWINEGPIINHRIIEAPYTTSGDHCLVQFKGKSYLFWTPSDQAGTARIDLAVDNRSLAEMLALTP